MGVGEAAESEGGRLVLGVNCDGELLLERDVE